MPTSATSRGDPPGTPRFPASLILLVIVEAVIVLAVAAWMIFAIVSLSRSSPTGVVIAQLLLMLVGAPLAVIGLANWAARALWRRNRRSIAVAVAMLPLLPMLSALGAAITM